MLYYSLTFACWCCSIVNVPSENCLNEKFLLIVDIVLMFTD